MEYDFLGECTVVKGLLNLKVTIIIFTVSTIGKQEILPSKYFFKYQYSMKYNQENILYGHLQRQVKDRLLQSLYRLDVIISLYLLNVMICNNLINFHNIFVQVFFMTDKVKKNYNYNYKIAPYIICPAINGLWQ